MSPGSWYASPLATAGVISAAELLRITISSQCENDEPGSNSAGAQIGAGLP